jgi:hypothetical protein
MKLRIRGNSIRLRLGQAEVGRIASGQAVEETTAFGGAARFGYRFLPAELESPAAHFHAGTITISWPKDAARAWAESQDVGLSVALPLDEGALQITVEKDFACLVPREGKEDVDTFPHPRAGSESC